MIETLIEIGSFELSGKVVSKCVDPMGDILILDHSTNKYIKCIGLEQADWIYQGCINRIQLSIGAKA